MSSTNASYNRSTRSFLAWSAKHSFSSEQICADPSGRAFLLYLAYYASCLHRDPPVLPSSVHQASTAIRSCLAPSTDWLQLPEYKALMQGIDRSRSRPLKPKSRFRLQWLRRLIRRTCTSPRWQSSRVSACSLPASSACYGALNSSPSTSATFRPPSPPPRASSSTPSSSASASLRRTKVALVRTLWWWRRAALLVLSSGCVRFCVSAPLSVLRHRLFFLSMRSARVCRLCLWLIS